MHTWYYTNTSPPSSDTASVWHSARCSPRVETDAFTVTNRLKQSELIQISLETFIHFISMWKTWKFYIHWMTTTTTTTRECLNCIWYKRLCERTAQGNLPRTVLTKTLLVFPYTAPSLSLFCSCHLASWSLLCSCSSMSLDYEYKKNRRKKNIVYRIIQIQWMKKHFRIIISKTFLIGCCEYHLRSCKFFGYFAFLVFRFSVNIWLKHLHTNYMTDWTKFGTMHHYSKVVLLIWMCPQ